MCGICGWINREPRTDLTIEILKNMSCQIRHRGPDAEGFFLSDSVALAHQRLSIIDLSNGQQPMRNAAGQTIVFNGEIYNFIELRNKLRQLGRVFKTQSDTEVLLEAYAEWGLSFLDRLIGMFSFAIYDPQRQELIMARDRLGKKPFFYFYDDKLFAFGSEIKSLLALPPVRETAKLDPCAVSDFLSLGYVLTPKTIFKNIRKLPAAHYAVFSLRTGSLVLKAYWDLSSFYHPDHKRPLSKATYDQFMNLLRDSVRIRLRSDVPLGGFLSGGIDSATVVALMKRESTEPVRTFCVGFKEKSYDESAEAKRTAQYLGVDFETAYAKNPSEGDVSRMAWFFDEPFADNSLIPMYLLNEEAKKRVTVVLSGDGGDELLAGYPTTLADHLYSYYQKIPGFLQEGLLSLAKNLLRPSYRKVSMDYKILQFLKSKGMSREKAHFSWRTFFSEEEKQRIMHPDIWKSCRDYDPFDTFKTYFTEAGHASFFDQTLYVDQKTWLQDDILVKVDRMSMAHAVEVRSPFLDHRLVEFAARLPQKSKFDGKKQKIILNDVIKSYLPEDVLRRPKRGFNYPSGYCGVTNLSAALFPGVLLPGFSLDPKKEDVTFKSFNLKALLVWLTMFEHYKKSGRWQGVDNA
jgi:asparagine synthase (glutamine-hydrolysing)